MMLCSRFLKDLGKSVIQHRAVSNATRHPSHLRKRITVRLGELWEDAGPSLKGLQYGETEKDVLALQRIGRTMTAWISLLQQNPVSARSLSTSTHRLDAPHLSADTILDLSDDEHPIHYRRLPYRERESMIERMQKHLVLHLDKSLSVLRSNRFREDEITKSSIRKEAESALGHLEEASSDYERWLEYTEYSELLGHLGGVASHFEDKQWILDSHGPLIRKAMGRLPIELDMLTPSQLMSAFRGITSFGPRALKIQVEQWKRVRTAEEIIDAIVHQAILSVDDLDGNQRCHLIEGMVNVERMLSNEQMKEILNDAYPLLKSRRVMNDVDPTNLCTLVWAMGKQGCKDEWKIVSTCLDELSQPKRFERLRASDMGRMVWGLGQMGIESGHEKFMDSVRRYLQFTVDVTKREMFNFEVIEFSEGLSRVNYSRGAHDIMEYLVRDVAKRRKPLTESQRERFMDACRIIGYPVRSRVSDKPSSVYQVKAEVESP